MYLKQETTFLFTLFFQKLKKGRKGRGIIFLIYICIVNIFSFIEFCLSIYGIFFLNKNILLMWEGLNCLATVHDVFGVFKPLATPLLCVLIKGLS